MEVRHQETPHMRIERLTRTFQCMVNQTSEMSGLQKQNKMYDCSECGLVFKDSEEMKIHTTKIHEIMNEEKKNQDIKIEENTNDDVIN